MNLKKVILSSVLLSVFAIPAIAEKAVVCPTAVKASITKYKNGDYVGCIQDLQDYTEKDPSNAIAYYYIGISYMKLGLKDSATEALEKVSTINTVPRLSSFATQAVKCMQDNVQKCTYKNFSDSQIEKYLKDPAGFLQSLAEEKKEEQETPEIVDEDIDIVRLIKGEYPSNIHPDANKTIQETRLLQEQERVNAEMQKKIQQKPQLNPLIKKKSSIDKNETVKISSAAPSDKEIADAVRTLSKAGYKFASPEDVKASDKQKTNQNDEEIRQQYQNMAERYAVSDDMEQMAMLFGDNSRSKRNDDWAMLNFLMNQKNPDGSKAKMDPELVKTMMMNQMMGDYDFGFSDSKDK